MDRFANEIDNPTRLIRYVRCFIEVSLGLLFFALPIFLRTLGTDRYLIPKVAVAVWMIILITLATAFGRCLTKNSAPASRLFLPWSFYTFVCAISIIHSIVLERSVEILGAWIVLMVLFRVTSLWVRPRGVRLCLFSLQVGATFSSLALLATGFGLFKVEGPLASSFGNQNYFSEYILMTLPIAIALALRGFPHDKKHDVMPSLSTPLKIAFGIFALIQFTAFYIAGSQGSWIGLLVALLLMGILCFFKRKTEPPNALQMSLSRRGLFFGGIIILCVIVVSIGGLRKGQDLWKETLRSFDVKQRNVSMRLLVWQASTRIIAENPLLGIGFGAYDETFPVFRNPEEWEFTGLETRANWAHNSVIHTSSECGALGLFGLFWLIASFVVLAARLSARTPHASRGLLYAAIASVGVGTFANSLVGTNFHLPGNLLLLALYSGFLDGELGCRIRKVSATPFTLWRFVCVSASLVIAFWLGSEAIRPYLSNQILAQGITEYNNKNGDAACLLIGRAQSVYPTGKNAEFHLAVVEQWRKHYPKATDVYDKLAQKYPNDFRIHNNLGTALERANNPEKASQAYTRSIALKGTDIMSIKNLARTLRASHHLREAMPLYERAIQLGTSDPATWVNAGDTAAELGDFARGASYYDIALRIKSDDGKLWYNYGIYLQNSRQFEKACIAYKRAVGLSPQLVFGYNNMGLCFLLLNKDNEAATALAKGLSIDPNNAELNLNSAILFDKMNQREKAEQYLKKAQSIAPNRKEFQVSVENLRKMLEQ